MASPSLDLGFKSTHVLITGGAGLIGSVVVEHFLAAGADVSSLDISYEKEEEGTVRHSEGTHKQLFTTHCDISSEESVKNAFAAARRVHGPVEVCIALASLDLSVLKPASFVDASFEQLQRILNVNIAGTWLTAREWLRGLRELRNDSQSQSQLPLANPNLILIGSESGHFGERLNAEYSLGKSAVQGGLLISLRAEVVREWPGARVNVVAPGPVDTLRWREECKERPDQHWLEAEATTALRQPIPPRAVAMTILSLASRNFSSHVHGQVVNVDGGKQGKVVWMKDEVA